MIYKRKYLLKCKCHSQCGKMSFLPSAYIIVGKGGMKENTERACKDFGPLIVSIDSYGRNYFEEKKVEYNQKKDEQIEIISKQVGFIK